MLAGVTLSGVSAWLFVALVAVWFFCAGYGVRARRAEREAEALRRERRATYAAFCAAADAAELAQAAAEYWRAEAVGR